MNKNVEIIDNDNSEPGIRSDEARPRRDAAAKPDILQRLHKLWCWYACQHGWECLNSVGTFYVTG